MRQIGAYVVFILVAGLLAFAIIGGRAIGEPASQSNKQLESMSLTSIMSVPARVSLPVNSISFNLSISAIYSQNGTSSGVAKSVTKNLSFKSNNESIATVNTGGMITGITSGTTFVTVSYAEGGITQTVDVRVTVTPPPPGT